MVLYRKTVVAITLAMAATGCVSQRHADDLQTVSRKQREQIVELRVQLEEKQAQVDALQDQLGTRDTSTLSRLQRAEAERDRFAQALKDAEAQLRSIGSGPILEPALDSALMKLARSNSGLMTYDAERGMVKFASDLTFALGSADVNPDAAKSLGKLAEIMRTPAGKGYGVYVVGHTDNVPIRKAQTRAMHPTNWHLSVHRAIAVKDALVAAGVPESVAGVAGYAEHRPVAANARGGSEANRRVEVYLVKQNHATEAVGATHAEPDPGGAEEAAAVAAPEPEPEPQPEPAVEPEVEPEHVTGGGPETEMMK